MKSIVKRCSVAAVLALAALMPDFRLLNTSPEGLALIADLEGCRLTPYQCSGECGRQASATLPVSSRKGNHRTSGGGEPRRGCDERREASRSLRAGR